MRLVCRRTDSNRFSLTWSSLENCPYIKWQDDSFLFLIPSLYLFFYCTIYICINVQSSGIFSQSVPLPSVIWQIRLNKRFALGHMWEGGDGDHVALVEGLRRRGDDPSQVVPEHSELLAGEHQAAAAVALAHCLAWGVDWWLSRWIGGEKLGNNRFRCCC